jgi:hypothetical protein
VSDLVLAADMSTPLADYGVLPAGCAVVCGYVGGWTPRDWTRADVAALERTGRAWWPIWTAPNPNVRLDATQGRHDGNLMVAGMRALGVLDGRPAFYDIEQSTYAASPAGARAAWRAWQDVLHGAGVRHAYPYLPLAAGYGWQANWTHVRPDTLPAGVIGVQYTGSAADRPYDLSVFDRTLLGDTMQAADVWDVLFTSPTNGKAYKASSYLIAADDVARQNAATLKQLTADVAALTKQVQALTAAVGKGGVSGPSPAAIAAGLGKALTAGAGSA